MKVTALRLLYACHHTYDHGSLSLEFWLCSPDVEQDVSHPADNGFQWLPAQTLKSLHFPAANEPVIQLLTADLPSVG